MESIFERKRIPGAINKIAPGAVFFRNYRLCIKLIKEGALEIKTR